MVSSDYMEIVCEHYDLSNSYTFNKVIMCTESEKESVIATLTNKLYNNIRNNVDKIDFGTIPLSKGDITKIDGYENLIDCINTISKLIKEYNQSTEQIDVISTAVNNIQERTKIWEKGFSLHSELPMIMYNTMVLSVVSSVSLLITTCIEYIKNGEGDITTAFDKASYIKTKDHVLFVSLRDFNAGCSKGETDKMMNNCLKVNLTKIKECYDAGGDPTLVLNELSISASPQSLAAIGVILVGLNIKWILQTVVYVLRNTVYYFMFMRQSVADYFTLQAEFLQINADNLQYRDNLKDDDTRREKVYNKQMKWVDRFRKWANTFMIKDKKAQKDADQQKKEDSKQNQDDDDDGGIF